MTDNKDILFIVTFSSHVLEY